MPAITVSICPIKTNSAGRVCAPLSTFFCLELMPAQAQILTIKSEYKIYSELLRINPVSLEKELRCVDALMH